MQEKEKHIEEIAQDIFGYCTVGGVCILESKKCDLKCSHRDIAERVYNAGYRKSQEVADEIFAEIETSLSIADFKGGEVYYAIRAEDYLHYKKKYTEEI